MTETIPAEVIEKMAEAATFPSEPYPVSDEQIKLALKAAEAAGFVLVPVEATVLMRARGDAESWEPESDRQYVGEMTAADMYRAMIAARPKVP